MATAVVVGGGLGPLLLALGLRRTSAASASLLLNLELVFTVVVAGLFFREHIGRRVMVGTSLIVAASVLVIGWTTPEVRIGSLLIAAACLCWAVDNSVTAAIDQLSPAVITCAKGVVAGSANLAIGLAVGGVPDAGDAALAVLVGMVGYGLSITWWVSGARHLGAARAQVVFATAPFFGVLIAWTVFADPVRTVEVAALVVAGVGVAIASTAGHQHAHQHEPLEHEHEHVHDDGHHDHVHADGFAGRHSHRHSHEALAHSHPHVPDLHHRHDHT